MITGRIVDEELVLNSTTLDAADNSVQRILDCVPPKTKILATVDKIPVGEEGLIINKPVTFGSKVGMANLLCSSGNITIRCAQGRHLLLCWGCLIDREKYLQCKIIPSCILDGEKYCVCHVLSTPWQACFILKLPISIHCSNSSRSFSYFMDGPFQIQYRLLVLHKSGYMCTMHAGKEAHHAEL